MATIRSEAGYSLMEVIISAALGTIVLAGAFDVYVSSTKNLIAQANNIQKQADAQVAMDYMVHEVGLAITTFTSPSNLAITQTLVANDTITFARADDSGMATGGSTTTLTDTSRNWTVGKFAPAADGSSYYVQIAAGAPGSGALLPPKILNNTATTLTLVGTTPFPLAPNNTSLYSIFRMKTFKLVADETLYSLHYSNGGTYHTLARNVAWLGFSTATGTACDKAQTAFPTLGTVCISLTTQSGIADPLNDGKDRLTGRPPSTHTLTSIVQPKN